jgi:quinol monooxygenase YgiN
VAATLGGNRRTSAEEEPMSDTVCTIAPYFEIQEGQLAAFKNLDRQFVERTKNEPGCVHYAFSYNGNNAHCREGYDDAKAVLAHLENIGHILQEALKISRLTRLELHGPAGELDRLRAPLAHLPVEWYAVEGGIRR